MKNKSLWSLAFFRLKNRFSKFMILSAIVGVTLFTVIILLAFSLSDQIISSKNTRNEYSCFLVSSNCADEMDVRDEEFSRDFLSSYGGHQLTARQYEEMRGDYKFEEITWLEFAVNTYGRLKEDTVALNIGDKEIFLEDTLRMKFFDDYDGLESLIPNSFISDFSNQYHKEIIKGKPFTDGKREMLLSEEFLDSMNLKWEDVIGKTVGLTVTYENYSDSFQFAVTLDDDNVAENLHKNSTSEEAVDYGGGKVAIFSDFKVVGVIDRDYFQLNEFTEKEAPIWMLMDVLTPLPYLSIQKVYSNYSYINKVVVTYPQTDYEAYSVRLTQEGYVFPFLVGNWYWQDEYDVFENWITPTFMHYIQCKNMLDADKCYTEINRLIHANNGGIYAVNGFFRQEFLGILTLSRVYKILIIVVCAIGALTLMTMLMVYVNSANLNKRKLKKFVFMLKSLGMHDKDIKLMRVFEMLLLIVIVSVISMFGSLIFSLLFNDGLQQFMATYGVALSLRLAFFPVSWLIAIAIMTVVLLPSSVLVRYEDA